MCDNVLSSCVSLTKLKYTVDSPNLWFLYVIVKVMLYISTENGNDIWTSTMCHSLLKGTLYMLFHEVIKIIIAKIIFSEDVRVNLRYGLTMYRK